MNVENLSGDLLSRTVLCAPANEAALRGMEPLVSETRIVRCTMCGKRVKIPRAAILPMGWTTVKYDLNLGKDFPTDIIDKLQWYGESHVCCSDACRAALKIEFLRGLKNRLIVHIARCNEALSQVMH